MKNGTYLSLIFLLLLTCYPAKAQQTTQSSLMRFLNNYALKHASIGICVKDISGKDILSHNAATSRTPASTLKLVTTASALEILGEDFVFKTEIFLDTINNRLIIRGGGDPTLGSEFNASGHEFLPIWVDNIKKYLNKPLSEIVIDDSCFGYESLSRKWIYEDIGNYYASGAYGISIFDNTYKLFFNTLVNNEKPVIVRTEPVIPAISFINLMTLNNTGRDNGFITGPPFSNQYILIGTIPSGRLSFNIKGAIPDPGLLLGQNLQTSLQKAGIEVLKVSTVRDTYINDGKLSVEYPKMKKIYTYRSPHLPDIIRVINERSNNHYSEHLIRKIGSENPARENRASPLYDGIDAVKAFWTNKGIGADALFMYDGCGLAPSDAVSPAMLCEMLIYMQTKSKNANIFLNSIPKAGQEGTVRNFMKNTGLKGTVYAKSGSIANVRCYAGYYIEGDKKYAFSVMVNNYNGSYTQVIRAIERLLSDIFKL